MCSIGSAERSAESHARFTTRRFPARHGRTLFIVPAPLLAATPLQASAKPPHYTSILVAETGTPGALLMLPPIDAMLRSWPDAANSSAVPSAPGLAGVRVWAVMSRGRGPRVGCPPAEGVDVAFYEAAGRVNS